MIWYGSWLVMTDDPGFRLLYFDNPNRCRSNYVVSGSLVQCGLREDHPGVHMFPKEWFQWDDAHAATEQQASFVWRDVRLSYGV